MFCRERHWSVPRATPQNSSTRLKQAFSYIPGALEAIARQPDPPKAPISSLSDESVQYLPRITTSSICLIDRHLFEFGSACPRISSGDPDRASRLVSNHKAQSSGVIAPDCTHSSIFINFDR